MGEQICEKCGQPKEDCICQIESALNKKGADKVIRVEHVGLPNAPKTSESPEELKQKLEEREAQLATLALKSLEKQKKALLATIKDENRRKYVDEFIGDDPEKLEQVKATAIMLGKALQIGGIGIEGEDEDTSVPPKGTATPKAPSTYDSTLQANYKVIDELYDILQNPKSTDEEKKQADMRIKSLLEAWISGRRQAYRQNPSHKYYIGVTTCPKCKQFIHSPRGTFPSKCDKCGAILTKRVK